MAPTQNTPTPRAPVSPSTSPAGTNGPWPRRNIFSSSHKRTNSTVPHHSEAPITPSSSSIAFNMRPGRQTASKALPSSRAATSSNTPASTSVAENILTMNDVTAKIPNLLPHGYYQCAGVSRKDSRCRRHVRNKAYCHSHDMQLLEAVSRDKDIVKKSITQVKAHKGPMEDQLAEIRDDLLCRHWAWIHVNNFAGLLSNIRKGPLQASERDQGCHALVPRFNRLYVCRGRTKVDKCCRVRVVGTQYCSRHNPSQITAGDVEMAFAEIWAKGGLSSRLLRW